MKHLRVPVRVPGRRLTAAAVTAVLAATGGILSTVPATATPVPVTAADTADQQKATVPFPRNAEVVGAGTTGFLSRTNGAAPELRWTRYADGTSTVLPSSPLRGAVSDVVVTGDHATDVTKFRVVTLHDMAMGAAPVRIDLNTLGEDHVYRGAVGATLVVGVKQADGTMEARLLTSTGAGLEQRTVTGLPAGTVGFSVTSVSSSSFALVVVAGPVGARTYQRLAGDVRTGAVTDAYPTSGTQRVSGALSDSHLVWDEETGPSIVIGTRGSTETRRIPHESLVQYGLVGHWLLTARPYVLGHDTRRDVQRPLSVRSLTDPEDYGDQLLEHMSSLVPGPDGSVLVRGGTHEHGEGLYRVTVGADGRPVAEQVAATGEPTSVGYLGADVPAVADFDRRKAVDLRWRFSRKNTRVYLKLTHTGTGASNEIVIWEPGGRHPDLGPDTVGWTWHGENLWSPWLSGVSGAYTWEIEAVPLDDVGRSARASGTITLVRKPTAHDYSGNIDPEIFARDSSGRLWVAQANYDEQWGALVETHETPVGWGWGGYDRLESVGDIAGTGTTDTLARDKDGVLWLYQGSGDLAKPFLGRVRVGGGWQTYDQVGGGSDLTGDGRPDVVATDRSGVLWLYESTGSASSPFETRKRIGAGWGIYNQVTAVGDLAGGPAGDLVARDRAGVLWLYLGKGDGTFAARTRIGSGWGTYAGLIGVGDVNQDGHPDLLARPKGSESFLYAGTGDWRAPFKPRRAGQVFTEVSGYNEVF
ncbi:VCBS repeat-containing protein [Streptomyces sp. NPDC094049]|uniref:FG-GAP repeat domain-containing protein n=1 Tax=Streptomyces sp. NPDC094049 TaxID=3154987 RepID=UPI00332A71A1